MTVCGVQISRVSYIVNVAGYPEIKDINRDAIDSLLKETYFPGTLDLT